jgi:hypothetical protein
VHTGAKQMITNKLLVQMLRFASELIIKIYNKSVRKSRKLVSLLLSYNAECVTYMAKYTACRNSNRNWLDTGIRGKILGTKLDSLPYEER